MGIVNKNFKSSHKTEIISLNNHHMLNHIFRIPQYQRNYAWGEEQIEDLMYSIDYLLQNKDSEELVYLGTIIVLQENMGTYDILDGQQRITTLLLYLKALRNKFELIVNDADYLTWGKSEIKKEFENKFNKLNLEKILYNQGSSTLLGAMSNSSNRIIYKNDKENKKYEFNSSSALDRRNKFHVNYNIIFKDIEKCFEKENKISPQKGLEYILALGNILTERVIFDFTITSDVADAFSIFESINTTGLLLSPSDIVSGRINSGRFSSLSETYNDTVDELISDRFDITSLLHYYVQIKKHSISIGKTEIVSYFNNITESQIEDLLMYFLIVKEFKDNNEVLFSLINTYFNRKQLWPLIYGVLLYNYTNEIKGQDNQVLELINFIMMFSILELNILKHSPGGIFKRILNIYSAEASKNGLRNIPNDCVLIELKDYLKTLSYDEETIRENIASFDEKYKKGMIIYYIYLNNTSIKLDLSKLNLEHVFPKNPHEDWFALGWPEDEDERAKLVNSFGNMILLNEKINKKISNAHLSKKKDDYEKHLDDALKASSINIIDYDLFENQREKYIQERTNKNIEMLLNMKPLKSMLSLLNNN